jgi:hypothetical protein
MFKYYAKKIQFINLRQTSNRTLYWTKYTTESAKICKILEKMMLMTCLSLCWKGIGKSLKAVQDCPKVNLLPSNTASCSEDSNFISSAVRPTQGSITSGHFAVVDGAVWGKTRHWRRRACLIVSPSPLHVDTHEQRAHTRVRLRARCTVLSDFIHNGNMAAAFCNTLKSWISWKSVPRLSNFG